MGDHRTVRSILQTPARAQVFVDVEARCSCSVPLAMTDIPPRPAAVPSVCCQAANASVRYSDQNFEAGLTQ